MRPGCQVGSVNPFAHFQRGNKAIGARSASHRGTGPFWQRRPAVRGCVGPIRTVGLGRLASPIKIGASLVRAAGRTPRVSLICQCPGHLIDPRTADASGSDRRSQLIKAAPVVRAFAVREPGHQAAGLRRVWSTISRQEP